MENLNQPITKLTSIFPNDWDKTSILRFLTEKKEFLAQHFHVQKMGLFGSFAEGTQKNESDIDLLVEFKENTPDLFFLKEDLRRYFIQCFGRSVDLVSVKAINKFFKASILKNAIFI